MAAKKIENQNTNPSTGPNDVDASGSAKETLKPLGHKQTIHGHRDTPKRTHNIVSAK